jgi:hypothetical protein
MEAPYTDYIQPYLDRLSDCYIQLSDNINGKVNSRDIYPNITEIENFYASMKAEVNKIDSEYLSEIIKQLDESKLIKITRKNYKELGIKLKTNMRIPISIQTEDKKIVILRYVLIPETIEDKKKLIELTGKKSIYPVDEYLGLSNLPFKITVKGMLKICNFAQRERSFKETSNLLSDACNIKLDPVTIISVVNHIGKIVFDNEIAKANETYKLLTSGKLKLANKKNDNILYIQVDGAMVNIREEAKTENSDINSENLKNKNSSWHENKLGLVYGSENVRITRRIQKYGHYEYRHSISKKEYTSYIGEVFEFKKLLFSCALRNGYGEYRQTILISDGATWIRNMKNELFPDAQQILDFYHLCEKVWEFSKTFYNKNESLYTPFAHEICTKLRQSKTLEVLEIIKDMEKILNSKKRKNKSNKDIIEIKLSKYIENNIDNVDYADYINKGYIIGSGAIESGNKCVMQYRLKQPGMI